VSNRTISADQILLQLIRAAFPLSGPAVQPPDIARADWPAIAERAQRERLQPLLHIALKTLGCLDKPPATVAQELSVEYLRCHVTNMLVRRELGKLLDGFSHAQIPTVLLKGSALIGVLYTDMGLRMMSDIDLLARPTDLSRVQTMMQDLGYVLEVEPQTGFQQSFRNVLGFESTGGQQIPVEVHWHISHIPYYRERIPIEWFWERTVALQMNGRPAYMFAPDAQLLHLAAHYVLRHQREGWAWAYDLALLLVRYREQLDWDEIAEIARRFGLSQTLYVALNDVEYLWQVSIPPKAKETIARLRPELSERFLFIANTAHHVDAKDAWDTFSLPGWSMRLGYLQNTLFPGRAYMQERYHIGPTRWLPPYYAARLLKGSYMFARSAFSILLNSVFLLFDSKKKRAHE
jgi:hypothetical protein